MAKKMHFTQIGKGRLSQEVQDAFLEAQKHVDSRRTSATVNVKITLYPPKPTDPNFGEIDYSTSVTKPASKSRRYPTIIENGEIIASGNDQTDALQLEAVLGEQSVPVTQG